MTIAQEEIFGPVLSVIAYDSEADAIRIANDSKYGLHAFISGKDPRCPRVAEQPRRRPRGDQWHGRRSARSPWCGVPPRQMAANTAAMASAPSRTPERSSKSPLPHAKDLDHDATRSRFRPAKLPTDWRSEDMVEAYAAVVYRKLRNFRAGIEGRHLLLQTRIRRSTLHLARARPLQGLHLVRGGGPQPGPVRTPQTGLASSAPSGSVTVEPTTSTEPTTSACLLPSAGSKRLLIIMDFATQTPRNPQRSHGSSNPASALSGTATALDNHCIYRLGT